MAMKITESGKMNEPMFQNWLSQLGKAWVTKDPNLVGSICSETVRYCENPFEEPRKGRQAVIDEWQNVPTSQKDITFDFDIIGITNGIGIAHWQASFTRVPSEIRDTLDGVFTVKLDSAGLCTEFRMWWVVKAQ